MLAVLFALGACQVAEQDISGVGDQFQQGLQGRGRIVPNDPLSDSFGSDYN
jgi:hypothetical protein